MIELFLSWDRIAPKTKKHSLKNGQRNIGMG